MTLYQIRTKFRDEIRPRFGLMRGREFLMYDGYSFDADAEGLDRSYRAQDAAYGRIFERCGLDFTVVQADSGAIGGTGFGGVHGPRGHGRGRRRAVRLVRIRRERREGADGPARERPGRTRRSGRLEDVETPGRGGIDSVVEFLGITASRMIKCLVYETDKGFVVALIRGDLDVNEVALKHALGVEHMALASEDKVLKATGAPVGFVGPHHLPAGVRVVADESVRGAVNAVTGAGKRDWHVRGLAVERDAKVERGPALRRRAGATPVRTAANPSTSPGASRSGTSSSSGRSTRQP